MHWIMCARLDSSFPVPTRCFSIWTSFANISLVKIRSKAQHPIRSFLSQPCRTATSAAAASRSRGVTAVLHVLAQSPQKIPHPDLVLRGQRSIAPRPSRSRTLSPASRPSRSMQPLQCRPTRTPAAAAMMPGSGISAGGGTSRTTSGGQNGVFYNNDATFSHKTWVPYWIYQSWWTPTTAPSSTVTETPMEP